VEKAQNNLSVDNIFVTKRSGETEKFNIDKIHNIVELACDGITGVSVSDIEMEAKLSFHDKMSTSEIHKSLTIAARDLISETNPNYQNVAGRLLTYDMRKTAWGGMKPPRLFEHITKMVEMGLYTTELLEEYDEETWDKLDNIIDHDRDLKMAFIAVKEYMTKYAVRDRTLTEVIPLETPQITYILASAIMALDTKKIKDIKSFYNDFSNHNISLPTPVMGGLRTPTKQFSSCVLIDVDDTLNSIFAATTAIGKYISKKAGIGINAGKIRAEASKVNNGTVKHTGVIPFYRLFESAVKSCSQGGIRGGAATLHTIMWHLDIESIIVLKNNKGTQDNRVRKLDYSIQINDYLYLRYMRGENITLFSPNEVPGLYDAYFGDKEKFIKLYEKYEKDKSIRKKSVPPSIFADLMTERKETGRTYIMNVDNVNSHSTFKVPIKMSNLCQEITLPTETFEDVNNDKNGEIALCTLAAYNLGNIKSLDEIESWARNAVRALDNILSYQSYVVEPARKSTMKYRPLGIGIINLAYYLAKNGVKYNDPKAWELLHETMEAISFYSIKASIELAKEKGACEGLEFTKYGDGLLPIDHYHPNVDKIVKPKYNLDWEWLRGELKQHGIRNATLLAMMPAETSAKMSNATNGVEPVRALLTAKGNKQNNSVQVVPELMRLKNKYDFLWEMESMDGYIKCMAIIQKFTCQSISSNLSYNPEHYENGAIPMSVLMGDVLKANLYGLKTLYYNNTLDTRDEDLEDKTEIKNDYSYTIDVKIPIEPLTVNTTSYIMDDDDDCDSCKI
jgi:ribonucleoside-diphosphate reductase alpha chain